MRRRVRKNRMGRRDHKKMFSKRDFFLCTIQKLGFGGWGEWIQDYLGKPVGILTGSRRLPPSKFQRTIVFILIKITLFPSSIQECYSTSVPHTPVLTCLLQMNGSIILQSNCRLELSQASLSVCNPKLTTGPFIISRLMSFHPMVCQCQCQHGNQHCE